MTAYTEQASGSFDPGGHGADQHHGRFSLPRVPQQTALRTAMQRLLTLGAVQAQSQQCVVAGLRLHYLEAGTGRTVVLLHGGSGGAANWFQLIHPLAQSCRVFAPDLPGFGLSQALQPRAPLGQQAAELLEHWLEQMNVPSATIIGTSFGGLVALRLAQRMGARINGLVLVDAAGLGREITWLARLASTPALGGLLTRPSRRGTRWQLRTLMVADIERIPSERQAALQEYLYQSAIAGQRGYLASALREFAGLRGQREVLDERELAGLAQPVLIVWGQRDRFLPVRHAHRAAALVPRARLSIIPDAGHSPNWEAPGALLEKISAFLRDSAHT